MTELIGYGVVCFLMTMCALGVVRAPNLVHAVFWLAGVLLATAAAFVLLQAPFLGMIQVVLYTGGVITLMLFGVMLTQHAPDTNVPNPSQRTVPAAVLSLAMFGTITAAILTTPQLDHFAAVAPSTSAEVGAVFLSGQLLAFEVLSMLLLAGMIGAIVLARKREPGASR